MRMLGYKASLPTFRWDLVYVVAQLLGDTRPGVSALAPPLQALLIKVNAERDALELTEDQVVVASALLHKKDKHRDERLIEAGGVARASDKAVYDTLFPRLSPSNTARLGVAAESLEISRILGEIGKLAPEHPVRAMYEQALIGAEAGVKAAGTQSDTAVTALAIQRSQLDRFKLELDQARLSAHGQLLSLLKDKAEADSFFRPTTSAPAEAPKADDPEAAATPVVATPA